MKRSGIGVIIKENNVREKIGIIDSEYIINEGKVMKNGRKEEIVEKKDVRRIYIGEKFKMWYNIKDFKGIFEKGGVIEDYEEIENKEFRIKKRFYILF